MVGGGWRGCSEIIIYEIIICLEPEGNSEICKYVITACYIYIEITLCLEPEDYYEICKYEITLCLEPV